MTDNDPLFDKSEPVFAALEKAAEAQGLIDEAIQLVLVRKGQLSRSSLEYQHLLDWHRAFDNIRNDIACTNALLAEQYGHPDWQIDEEE